MIDPRILRTEPEILKESLRRRGVDRDVDSLVALDERRRVERLRAEEIRAEQKTVGKSVSKLQGDEKQAAIARAGELSGAYKEALAVADASDGEFNDIWVSLPNIVDETAADGTKEEDSETLRTWGEPPEGEFLDHVELGEKHRLLDVERAAKVSGSRFGYLLGPMVRLEFALVNYALDKLEPHGFTPVVPPVLVRDHALYGTGFFPGDRDQVYSLADDDLYLIGTSEVALGDELYARESIFLNDYPDQKQLILQAIQIGDLAITAVPCEVFVEIGLEIKAKSPFEQTFCISLANGYNGYLPTPKHHAWGGYETWRARSSYLEVNASDVITSNLLGLQNNFSTYPKKI